MTLVLATLLVGGAACNKREAGGEGLGSAAASAAPAPGTASGEPGLTADKIKIGSWGPLSGPAAQWGVVLHSMNAYFQYVNASGGVHGRKIEFVYRDDQYSPAKTPAVVRELVEKEQVFAIVGGIGTANGRAVADYLEQKRVPFFTPSSGDRFWSEGGKKNVYTVFPKYVTEGEILGDYAGRELKSKRVAVLFQDDDFGKQGLEGVKKGLAKHTGSQVVAEVSCQPVDTDLSGQASKVVEAKPDLLILYAAPKQAVTLVKTLDAQKKKPQVMTSFVLSDPILFKLAGESWEGTITSAASKMPDSDDEAVKLYREVLDKYGGGKLPVGTFSLSGFLFAIPLVEAMHKAGKDLTREKLYTALHGFQGWTGPALYWKGENMGPPISFGPEQRLGNDKIYLAKAKAGKWEKLTDYLSPGS
jgi:branched-chain amino acid transport system substrate-binding protein